MARITKESLLQLSKELEVLTAEETKSFLGGTNSTVQPLGDKKDKDKEPIYVAPPLPEVVVTPGGSSQSYDKYMYNQGYNTGYRAGTSESNVDDIILGLGALLAPNTTAPGTSYDATTYPGTSSYSSGVINGIIDGRAAKDAKKK